jgi:hypothetical protein
MLPSEEIQSDSPRISVALDCAKTFDFDRHLPIFEAERCFAFRQRLS